MKPIKYYESTVWISKMSGVWTKIYYKHNTKFKYKYEQIIPLFDETFQVKKDRYYQAAQFFSENKFIIKSNLNYRSIMYQLI